MVACKSPGAAAAAVAAAEAVAAAGAADVASVAEAAPLVWWDAPSYHAPVAVHRGVAAAGARPRHVPNGVSTKPTYHWPVLQKGPANCLVSLLRLRRRSGRNGNRISVLTQ